MKILQVYPYFYPAWGYGGATRVSYEISRRLAEIGHEVTVYATDALDNKSRIKMDSNPTYIDGMKIYYFKNLSNYLTYKYHIPLPFRMAFRIKEEVKKFDVIHLHGYPHFLNVLVHHYAKKYKIPYVLQPRGSVPRMSKSKLKKLFDALFGRSIVKDASKIIATSKIESEQYWDVFPELNAEKIVHIPNGIDLSEYSNLPEKGEFRRKYSINDDEKVILFLGRIHEIKGLDLLVGAFADLLRELDAVKLVIVGPDDGYISSLKEIVTNLKIDDKVLFTGLLFERDKLKAYVDADVFVLPSRYESFGNVALEACACGTPVIVTNNCGVSEWIGDDVGYVVEYDKEELRNALFKILSDEGLRRRFGEEGKKLVREKFGWDGIVRKIEGVYEDCIRG